MVCGLRHPGQATCPCPPRREPRRVGARRSLQGALSVAHGARLSLFQAPFQASANGVVTASLPQVTHGKLFPWSASPDRGRGEGRSGCRQRRPPCRGGPRPLNRNEDHVCVLTGTGLSSPGDWVGGVRWAPGAALGSEHLRAPPAPRELTSCRNATYAEK